MLINTFTGPVTSKYAAFDTETRVRVDGVVLSDDTIRRMCEEQVEERGELVPRYPVSWWRKHATVECWAFIVYTPEGFAIAETWDEFTDLIVRYRIRHGWWYYAPFDFAIIDHHLLSSGFTQAEKHATAPCTFCELSSEFGSRYSMEICFPYKRERGDRSRLNKWRVCMYDLRNIFGGGLRNLLETFDVRDADGTPIRKLDMDYQAATGSADDVAYMRADAAGLWWLIQQASAYMEEHYGFSIRGGRPDILTASGLAKRVYLRERYPDEKSDGRRVYRYQREHPMTIEADTWLRCEGLLQGGLVIVNPAYQGQHLKGLEAYRADVNSEYPFIMEDLPEIYGHPDTFQSAEQARRRFGEDACVVLCIDRLNATVRPGMVPAWRHPITGKISDHILISEEDAFPFAIFEEELEELRRWYEIHGEHILRVYAWRTQQHPAMGNLIRREYARKTAAKIEHDKVKAEFSKLIMNGLGGKFSQNPRRYKMRRKMIDGVVYKMIEEDEDGEPIVDVDPKALMHVVQGAWITCRGRCYLRRLAREICGDRVAERLLYTDTDSLHVTVKPPPHLVDPTRLGALKLENSEPITAACFLAPKTYYELSDELEIHAKGVRKEAILAALSGAHGEARTLEDIYTPGKVILSESALNVAGGKAILPLPKRLCKVTAANYIDEIY